ncbi:phosphoglucosamine mutase [Phycisphaerales bacterium AB-hyl4]|uniref:Phosphoglucosamine mutase n=1 Tax=Natronomicrosphaera hydrolytica TaxID=3242702 RepID=A0ABV4U8B9_9BACT
MTSPTASAAPLMLSVSGARGIVGQSLTPTMIARYAAAVGSWLREQVADRPPHVVLGRDSRPSGPLCEHAAIAGLLGVGCRVTCLGVATTPGVAIMTQHLGADGGMVITASHNPIIWNGIKTLRHDGVAPPPDQAKQIIDRFHDDRIDYVDVESLQPVAYNDDTPRVHRDAILPHIDASAIRNAKLKVVVDGVHGAGGMETAAMLEALGVACVHKYADPTGRFPHPPEPTAEHLTELCELVPTHGAAVGFAQDPDADRLAIVDEQGRYIGEEYTLALCARHVLKAGQVAAANLSTSRMLDDVAAAVDGRVVRTPVGEANVAAGMQQYQASIGGEGNGGIILPKVSYVRDSLVGIALVLEMLAKRQKPLSEIVAETPSYAILKDKVPVDPELVKKLGPTLRGAFADAQVDDQDGVRLDWADRWVHVRPSNTEPILRLIAEARDDDTAQALLAQTREALGL